MTTSPDRSTLGVGVIGCGNISVTYLRLMPLFRGIALRAVADIDMEIARARAGEFGTRALSVEDLLADDAIDIVVNLTIPSAHGQVTRSILEAGKHAYSEKPVVLSLEDGLVLQGLAASKGLRIGSAPDTFLGGTHQMARALIDQGKVGTIVAGTCHMMSHGMEHWHPNPDFFFLPGGGPMLDIGPYYITNLIQLLGPVKRVAALATAPSSERVIFSQPRAGERIPVKTPTNIHALLVPSGRDGHRVDQLGRVGAPPCQHGALRHQGLLVRTGSERLWWPFGNGRAGWRHRTGDRMGSSIQPGK